LPQNRAPEPAILRGRAYHNERLLDRPSSEMMRTTVAFLVRARVPLEIDRHHPSVRCFASGPGGFFFRYSYPPRDTAKRGRRKQASVRYVLVLGSQQRRKVTEQTSVKEALMEASSALEAGSCGWWCWQEETEEEQKGPEEEQKGPEGGSHLRAAAAAFKNESESYYSVVHTNKQPSTAVCAVFSSLFSLLLLLSSSPIEPADLPFVSVQRHGSPPD